MMLGWLFGNLFLLAIILVAVGSFLLLGTVLNELGWHAPNHPMLWTGAAILSLAAAYIVGKYSLRYIERKMNRRT